MLLGERETSAAIRAIIPMAVERVAVIDDLEQKGDGERLLLLCGVIRRAEQLDDRESCVILRPVTDSGPQSGPSVAIWSAQRNSDILAEAIGKPTEVVGPDP